MKYPDNQGCISKVWNNGWHFSKDYPDPSKDPVGYANRSKEDGIPQQVVDRFRMKSRLYCGCRIWDSKKERALAVLMLEATHPDRYTEEGLKKILDEREQEYVGRMVETLKHWIPDYEDAREKGL